MRIPSSRSPRTRSSISVELARIPPFLLLTRASCYFANAPDCCYGCACSCGESAVVAEDDEGEVYDTAAWRSAHRLPVPALRLSALRHPPDEPVVTLEPDRLFRQPLIGPAPAAATIATAMVAAAAAAVSVAGVREGGSVRHTLQLFGAAESDIEGDGGVGGCA